MNKGRLLRNNPRLWGTTLGINSSRESVGFGLSVRAVRTGSPTGRTISLVRYKRCRFSANRLPMSVECCIFALQYNNQKTIYYEKKRKSGCWPLCHTMPSTV